MEWEPSLEVEWACKLAPDVLHRDQDGEGAFGRSLHLVVALAEFGLDERQAELSVKIRFLREGAFRLQRFQTARDGGELAQVRLRTRALNQRQAPVCRARPA